MKQPTPPKWAIRFFQWYCRDELSDAVLGDLLELFDRRLARYGKRRADGLFVWNVIWFIQPFALKRKSRFNNTNLTTMFSYHFKISWRNLSRQKMYSSIKIGGFAIGIAASLLIALFIRDELSYDRHYANGDRIFRILNVSTHPEHRSRWSSFPAPVGEVLKNEFPEIEVSGRLIPYDWFDAGDNQFRPVEKVQNTYEDGFAYADPEVLEILEIPMTYGDRTQALAAPNTLVISRRKAESYFPGQDPVGKTVILNEDESNPYTIGGVMENFPDNSHLQYDFLLTLTGKEFWPGEQSTWFAWNYNPYVRVKPGINPEELEKKLLIIRDNYIVPAFREAGDKSADDAEKYLFFELQPVKDIYLRSETGEDVLRHGDVRIVWLFGVVAGFILLLACINFINLSTARSANRAKEVGLQKVVGSHRMDLIRQFLTESSLYSLIACLIGIGLAGILLPFFNQLADKDIILPWNEWWFFPVIFLFILLIGLLSGLYPAFYLSAFRPVQVLKGHLSRGSKSSGTRSALVIFQFTTSIVLVICTLVTLGQMDFILNKKLGFTKDQVILIKGANTLNEKRESFKNELLTLSSVTDVTVSDYLPIEGTKRDQNPFWREGRTREDRSVNAQKWIVDDDYLETLGISLINGRNFSRERASDSTAIIINESMAKEFGFEQPIGERITNNYQPTFHIIGVIADFHFETMKGEIRPLSLVLGKEGSIASVKVKSNRMSETLDAVTNTWEKFMPHQPIRLSFLDEGYARMYADVHRTGKVFTVFSVLAIIVACLGLFALSAFMVEQRSKEISIRKVLGASFRSIFSLLTVNFLKLVLISLVIAIPAGWYLMLMWLEDFAYRIEIQWWVFVASGAISLTIALLTITSESVKAALVNPVKGLRSE